MSNPCKDPRRRCMKLCDWPAPDRHAWEAAVSPGSVVFDAGVAAHWRPGTHSRVVQSYGRFLNYLHVEGQLDLTVAPGDRVDRETVIAYVTELQTQVESVTVHGYVVHLERALAVMAPDTDWHWLARLAARLGARAEPSRDKRHKVVPIEDLFDLSIRLMDEAHVDTGSVSKRAAVRFRDGLMIALLSHRMLRRRSFINLSIGAHLKRASDGYRITLDSDDTKNGRSYEAPLPGNLTPSMDAYLDLVRPVLLGERHSGRLWITHTGTDMADSSFYIRIREVTKRELGRPINPHLFRDCAMTSRAIDDPDNIRSMQPLLGHSSMTPSERHYNHAKAIEAARDYQSLINRKRRTIANKTRKKRRQGG